jgi:hypothetical protein
LALAGAALEDADDRPAVRSLSTLIYEIDAGPPDALCYRDRRK